jgi:hypothetical protein
MWARRLDLSAKAFSQIWQVNGFSPAIKSKYKNELNQMSIDYIRIDLVFNLITCMSSDVTLQEPRPGERFTTIGAFASLTVGSDVH